MEKDSSNYIEFDLRKEYPIVEKGKGIYVYDVKGRKYIDGCGGALVVSIGHGQRKIVKAMVKQAKKIAYVHRILFTSNPTQGLAKKICSLAPGDLNKAFFTSGGSEAVESAIKIARKYHIDSGKGSKYKIVARWQSYHGNTLGALSASGHSGRRREYDPYLRSAIHITPCYCYRCPFHREYPTCGIECALELDRVIKQEGAETVSAFIAEPIVGAAAGATVPPIEYFKIIRGICEKHQVLMIADEVMTGFGRTGKNFAIEHWDVIPDIIVFGKGVTSGYSPLAGIVVKDLIVSTIKKVSGIFFHGFTYGGNPLSSAVGIAVVDFIQENNLIRSADEMGNYLLNKLMELNDLSSVGDVRGKGLMVGVEFVKDRKNKEPFPVGVGFSARVVQQALENGLCVYPGGGTVDGIAGDHILIGPPFIITEKELDDIVKILKQSIIEVEKEIGRLKFK
jgi:adenosylmethionine-8-amino-7-oxononanoate aminotransferase